MSDEVLKQIAKDVALIKSALAAGALAIATTLGAKAPTASAPGARTAGDRDLDSPYGDPEVRRDPPRWEGESFVGRTFSATSPEYLDCLADFKEWQAAKDDETGAKDAKGRPKSHWAKKDAGLARGWAARLRAGWKPKTNGVAAPVSDEDYGDGADDGVPF